MTQYGIHGEQLRGIAGMSWPLRPISDLCEFAVDCVNKTAPVVDQETPYKMIRTTNVKGGFINTQDVRYVSKDTFEKWTRRSRPQYGDIVLTREAPVGEVGRCTFQDDDNIFLGQRLFHYRPDPSKLDWNFLAYVIKSPEVQGRLHGRSFGATIAHVKVSDAESLLIPCPTLNEQRRIGNALANYDDLIETNRRRITLLEESARLLYREWFVQLRFPGYESTSVASGLPEGWSWKKVGELTAFLNRGIAPKYDDAAEGLVINQKCIRDGLLNLAPARRQAKAVKAERLLQVGDVLINSTGAGTLGRVAQVRSPLSACTADTHVTIARPINVSSAAYLGVALLELEPLLATMGVGSTNQLELGRANISALSVLEPPVSLQQDFHERVWPMFTLSETLSQANQSLQLARDALLPQLMSGQLDVSSLPLPEAVTS